jgi:hypothetical protein
MKAEIIGKNGSRQLVITIDMQKPTASASGKTLVIASSHGNQPTTLTVDGKAVIVGLNAYIRNA